jgi:hypothetical protein
MDVLDFFINFFNLIDNSNFIKIHFEKFTDCNEYLGVRIISFLSFIILTLCYIAIVFGILFLIFKLFKKM